jgi:hypothetical protein
MNQTEEAEKMLNEGYEILSKTERELADKFNIPYEEWLNQKISAQEFKMKYEQPATRMDIKDLKTDIIVALTEPDNHVEKENFIAWITFMVSMSTLLLVLLQICGVFK